MNEKTIDQIEEEVPSYEVSDEAVEAAGTTEIAGVWTFVCTSKHCNHSAALVPIPAALRRGAGPEVVAGEEPRHPTNETPRPWGDRGFKDRRRG
jgi:hypothetical protein